MDMVHIVCYDCITLNDPLPERVPMGQGDGRIVLNLPAETARLLLEVKRVIEEEQLGIEVTTAAVARHLIALGYKQRMRNAKYRLSSEPQSGG